MQRRPCWKTESVKTPHDGLEGERRPWRYRGTCLRSPYTQVRRGRTLPSLHMHNIFISYIIVRTLCVISLMVDIILSLFIFIIILAILLRLLQILILIDYTCLYHDACAVIIKLRGCLYYACAVSQNSNLSGHFAEVHVKMSQ